MTKKDPSIKSELMPIGQHLIVFLMGLFVLWFISLLGNLLFPNPSWYDNAYISIGHGWLITYMGIIVIKQLWRIITVL
jgi:hypothetical protein